MTMAETLLLREEWGDDAWIAPVLAHAVARAVVVRAERVALREKAERERETILLAGAGPGRW